MLSFLVRVLYVIDFVCLHESLLPNYCIAGIKMIFGILNDISNTSQAGSDTHRIVDRNLSAVVVRFVSTDHVQHTLALAPAMFMYQDMGSVLFVSYNIYLND